MFYASRCNWSLTIMRHSGSRRKNFSHSPDISLPYINPFVFRRPQSTVKWPPCMFPHFPHTRRLFFSISPIPVPCFDTSSVLTRCVLSLLVTFNQLIPLQQSVPPPPPSSAHTAVHATASKPDPLYGHEYIYAGLITHLFTCPKHSPSSTHSQAQLPVSVASSCDRTNIHPSDALVALACIPTARGSSGHRLFSSTISSKVICDDTSSDKFWPVLRQGTLELRKIYQMEREMCSHLDWEITIDPSVLADFEDPVKRDVKGPGPYPTYSLQMQSPHVPSSTDGTTSTAVVIPKGSYTALPDRYAADILIQAR